MANLPRSIIWTLLILAVAAAIWFLSTQSSAPNTNPQPPTTAPADLPTTLPLTINGKTFTLDLALDPKTQEQGLSDRRSIDPDGGMLFVFPQPIQLAFVMRRCHIPIDLIFISPTGAVINWHHMTVEPNPDAPDRQLTPYRSDWPYLIAIELAGGAISDLHLEKGQQIGLSRDQIQDLKRRAR